jgi:hypothetical protein
MRLGFKFFFLLLAPALALAQAAAGVALSGLTLPISVAWDAFGNIFVLEKAGLVKQTTSWIGVPTRVVLDITGIVASYGDHGATSILVDEGFLYVTYVSPQQRPGA